MFPRPLITPLPDHLKWECVTPKKGESVKGVLAGEVHPVAVHWDGKANKPCVRFMTDGKVPCHCDETPCSLRVIGYVPLITREREKLVVICASTLLPRIESVKPGTPVEFSRPNKEKKALSLTLLRDFDIGEDFVKRLRPACMHNICEYLLHLWQMPILNVHFGIEYRPASARITAEKTEDEAA